MAQALAFGTYIPGTSPVHALNAQVKIILACVFSIAVFFVESWLGLLIVTAFVAMLYMMAHVPVTKAARGLIPIIFILVFVGMALQASGARMARQAKFLREGIEDQLILEQAKGADGLTREQLAERIVVPRHTILVQYFPLYVLPVIVIVIGYFFFSLLGFL